jgi:protein TonB
MCNVAAGAYRTLPEYLEEARRLRVQGTTELSVIAGVDGRSHDIHIVRRLGHGLDEKAIEALTR